MKDISTKSGEHTWNIVELEWEDVIQFEGVEGYGKSIWKNEDKYYLVLEEGTVASWLAVYDLPKELFSLLDSGERSLLRNILED